MGDRPHRVQLRRTKGWKMPPNTVKVDRRTKWGNPFDFRGAAYCWAALAFGCRGDKDGRQEASVIAFRQWIAPEDGKRTVESWLQPMLGDMPLGPRVEAEMAPSIKEIRAALRGKNLACWCKPGSPCHADVLLEIAND